MEQFIDTDTALDIFGLDRNYTIKDLVNSYKKVSKLVHPDKGGSKEMFQTVLDCYTFLLQEHKYLNGGTAHNDLKKDFEDWNYQEGPVVKRDFNIDEFNSNFEYTKEGENGAFQNGYGKLMSDDSCFEMPKYVSSGEFQARFNERQKSISNNSKGQIIVKPLERGDLKSSLGFTEMGIEEVDDFSTKVGGIDGCDCKLAYTEDGYSYQFCNTSEKPLSKNDYYNYVSERDNNFNADVLVRQQEEHFLKQQQQQTQEAIRRREIMRKQHEEALIRNKKAELRISNFR